MYLSVQNLLGKINMCANYNLFVKSWFFWAGISFIIGGMISLALNLSVQGRLTMLEDMTGYSIGWISVGVVLLVYSIVKNKNEKRS